jgi:hypothetical protein
MKIGQLWRNQATFDFRKKLGRESFDYWNISCPDLFGDDPVEGSADEMYCFTMGHYVHFLDNVGSLHDLIEGLFQLSPFVDDAFLVAQSMSESDFVEFKLSLISERKAAKGEGESKMPQKYFCLLLPGRFPSAILLAEKACVSMGPALIRIMETEMQI